MSLNITYALTLNIEHNILYLSIAHILNLKSCEENLSSPFHYFTVVVARYR